MTQVSMKMTSVKPFWVCDPSDDRCVRAIEPQFYPGISVRHSPSCTGEICNLFGCDGGNWRVTNQGTLDRAEWIKGWIITQLFTRGLVSCEEHPLGKRDGGWWADAYRAGTIGDRFNSGSKLWALQWRHGGATNELLMMAQDYAYAALDPLRRWGLVSKLSINALWAAKGNTPTPGAIIHLKIAISGPGVINAFTLEGTQLPTSDWLWKEYMPQQQSRAIGRLYGGVKPWQ